MLFALVLPALPSSLKAKLTIVTMFTATQNDLSIPCGSIRNFIVVITCH
jgi:hypothetical protein